jgi:hypothetical protein
MITCYYRILRLLYLTQSNIRSVNNSVCFTKPKPHSLGFRRCRSPVAELYVAVQVHFLQQGTKFHRILSWTRLLTNAFYGFGFQFSRVLDVKHRLRSLDESSIRSTFVVLYGLFVDGEVDNWQNVSNNVASVLEAYGHIERMGFCRKVVDKINGVGLGQS